LIKLTAFNSGPEAAPLHLCCRTLWFSEQLVVGKRFEAASGAKGPDTRVRCGAELNTGNTGRVAAGRRDSELLFTENETQYAREFKNFAAAPYVKDGFHSYLIRGNKEP